MQNVDGLSTYSQLNGPKISKPSLLLPPKIPQSVNNLFQTDKSQDPPTNSGSSIDHNLAMDDMDSQEAEKRSRKRQLLSPVNQGSKRQATDCPGSNSENSLF